MFNNFVAFVNKVLDKLVNAPIGRHFVLLLLFLSIRFIESNYFLTIINLITLVYMDLYEVIKQKRLNIIITERVVFWIFGYSVTEYLSIIIEDTLIKNVFGFNIMLTFGFLCPLMLTFCSNPITKREKSDNDPNNS